MRTTIAKFGHSIVSARPGQGHPHPPYVVVELKEWARQSTTGAPVVSPDLATKADIDAFVTAMKANLDEVGAKAKRALATAEKRSLTLVKSSDTV